MWSGDSPGFSPGFVELDILARCVGFKRRLRLHLQGGSLGNSELTIPGLLGFGPVGVSRRYIHLDAALAIAADQVAAEIERLLQGGELLSRQQVKKMRLAERARILAAA